MVAEERDVAEVRESVPDFLQWFNKDSQIITREGFYGLIKRGIIPHFRLGGRIFLNRHEVMNALRQGSRGK